MGTQSKWIKEINEFISWRCNPDNAGKKIDDWAEEHKVPVTTVYGWSSDKGVKAQMVIYFNEHYRKDEVAVISALLNKAKTGDVPAISLYAKWIEGWSEKNTVDHTGEISVDANALADALDKIRSRKRGK